MSRELREQALLSRLSDAQLSRRRVMQGLLATGGAAAFASWFKANAVAQTPSAGATPVELYVGLLAEVQEMRLPGTEPAILDPAVSFGDGDEVEYFFNLFDGLTGVDNITGEIVPRVAESYSSNDDASEFTFVIRQGVTWSDGTPINAHDFVYSWQRVLDPDTISQYLPAMYVIKNAQSIVDSLATPEAVYDASQLGVVATDDYTLVVTLEAPTPYFPLLTATWTYAPVPRHVFEEHGDQWVEAGNMVSNGPFVLSAWEHNQELVLEQNPNYYGTKPTLTRATYRLFQDTSTQAFVAFEANELDYAAPTGPDLERVLADPSIGGTIIEFPLSNCFFVVCDTRIEPTSIKEFRQALYKSIDRNLLANTILKGQYIPAFTVMSPDIPGNNPDAAMPESVDEAKALLATAGIDPASVEIELAYINEPARLKTVAEYLQAAWQDGLGIKVNLATIEDAAYPDWRASKATDNFNTYTGSWGSDFVDASNWFNQNFTTEANHYQSAWSNAEFDELCEKAASNANIEERNEQYRQAEVILVEEASIIPLYRGKAFRCVKPYVKDVYFQSVLSVVHLRTIKIAAQ
jgi:oligopeptide transport system substrate-binding protein